jgi:ribosomal protein L18
MHAALHGLTRALTANAVQGVSTGFVRELDIRRTGYRADVKGKIATFVLGYSHPIELLLPESVDLKIDKQTHLVLVGTTKQALGQVAANIRALRKPDPYKNKGVRYTGEVLRKKAGKTGAERRQMIKQISKDTFAGAFIRVFGAKSRASAASASRHFPQRGQYLCAGIDDARATRWSRHLRRKDGRRQGGGNVAARKEIGKLIAERAKDARASSR